MQVYLVLRILTSTDEEMSNWNCVEDVLKAESKAGLSKQHVPQQQQQQQPQQADEQHLHPALIERFSHAVPVPQAGVDAATSATLEDVVRYEQHGTTYVWTRSMITALAAVVSSRLARYDDEARKVGAHSSGEGPPSKRRKQAGGGETPASTGAAHEAGGSKRRRTGKESTAKVGDLGHSSGGSHVLPQAELTAGLQQRRCEQEVSAAMGLRVEEQRLLQIVLQRLKSWGVLE